MEQKNQTGNKEYQFIREKVVSRRKNRIKKMGLSIVFTVFLAVIFGVVARAVFLYADGPLRRFFGLGNELAVTPTQRPTPTRGIPTGSEISTGGASSSPSGGAAMTPPPPNTPEATLTAIPVPSPTQGADVTPSEGATVLPERTPTPISGEVSPSGEPTGSEEVSPTGSGEASPSGEPTGGGITPAPSKSPTPTPSFAEQYAALFWGMQEVAQKTERSLVTITVTVNGIDWLNNPYETESQTTGIVIGKSEEELLVLVNLDRIQSASRISLTVNREHYEAELWSYDRDYNMAVVRVATEDLPERFVSAAKTALFGESAQLAVGTPILALGNPNGYVGSREFGMVTSRESIYYITDNSVELFNTNTTDSEDGDGVIVNLAGEIVGIITRTMKAGLDEEMCTAVGITKLKNVIERLATGQERVYFGIRGEDMPMAALREQGLSNGIYVTEVESDSPAFEAGIKTGDIITKVDDNFIYSFSGFDTLLNLRTPGMEMEVTLWRTVRMQAEEIKVAVVLGER